MVVTEILMICGGVVISGLVVYFWNEKQRESEKKIIKDLYEESNQDK